MTASASVKLGPKDEQCKYWAKIVRAGAPLPLPCQVSRADDLPAPYQRVGDEELFPGDILFEGEANHPRYSNGWAYSASIAGVNGEQITLEYNSEIKARLKNQGLDKRFLTGAGDLAGLVRIAHGLRAGLSPREDVQPHLVAAELNDALPSENLAAHAPRRL